MQLDSGADISLKSLQFHTADDLLAQEERPSAGELLLTEATALSSKKESSKAHTKSKWEFLLL